jgi:hypothetical protein
MAEAIDRQDATCEGSYFGAWEFCFQSSVSDVLAAVPTTSAVNAFLALDTNEHVMDLLNVFLSGNGASVPTTRIPTTRQPLSLEFTRQVARLQEWIPDRRFGYTNHATLAMPRSNDGLAPTDPLDPNPPPYMDDVILIQNLRVQYHTYDLVRSRFRVSSNGTAERTQYVRAAHEMPKLARRILRLMIRQPRLVPFDKSAVPLSDAEDDDAGDDDTANDEGGPSGPDDTHHSTTASALASRGGDNGPDDDEHWNSLNYDDDSDDPHSANLSNIDGLERAMSLLDFSF